MGLLDMLNTPAGMGLLSAAVGGLAGARRGTPFNNVGRAGIAGLTGYAQANDQIRQDEENAFQKQFRQTQMDQARRAMEKDQKTEQWYAGLGPMLTPKVSEQGAMLNDQDAVFGDAGTQATLDAGQYAPNAQLRITPQIDREALQSYMLQPESPVANKFLEGMIPKPAKWAMGERFNEATGMPEKVMYDENDPSNVMPFGGQKQNIPEGMQMVNGRLVAMPGYVDMKEKIARAGASQTVTYGAPTPVINPQTGEPELVQFSPVPGADPRPTGYKPPPKGGSGSGPMSVTLQKELIESDDISRASGEVIRTIDSALALNDKAYSGYGAKERARVRSNIPGFPESEEANATINLDNMVTGQALESLKLIFGGTPTEGERQILLDMQASADKTPAQRKAILERARTAAERRGQFASSKSESIRNGSYLTEGAKVPDSKPKQTNKAAQYNEYVAAYRRATTKEQRDAINARAREIGVIK